LFACTLVAGCGGAPEHHARDAAAPGDLAAAVDGAAGHDLAAPPDLASEPDLASAFDCFNNVDCAQDQYCALPPGCAGPGNCTKRPVQCAGDCPYVCTCDFKSFCNACVAAMNGANVRS